MSTRNEAKPKQARKGRPQKVKSVSSSSSQMSRTHLSLPPVAKGVTVLYKEPQMTSLSKGGVRVRHREYVLDIVSGGLGFEVIQFEPINPGNETMFPWLSRIATRFESYMFSNLTFHVEPLQGTIATGAILMAVDFEAADPRPSSKVMMMSYEGAVRSPVWDSCRLPSSVSNLQKIKKKFTLDHAPPRGQDVRLYNVGNLIVAATGTASTTIGELYVEYDVTFETPQIESQEEVVQLRWDAPTLPNLSFDRSTSYTQAPPANTESNFGFGTAAGLAATAFVIYKAGSYLWESWMGAAAPTCTFTPTQVVAEDSANTALQTNFVGMNAGLNSTSDVNNTNWILQVNKTPAVYYMDPAASLGVGSSINTNSSIRISAL